MLMCISIIFLKLQDYFEKKRKMREREWRRKKDRKEEKQRGKKKVKREEKDRDNEIFADTPLCWLLCIYR